MLRNYSIFDRVILHVDAAVRTVFGTSQGTERVDPATEITEATLSEPERRHVAGLMRVNHAGEVAAQALYHGQALTARLPRVREKMERAAQEENDHLAWCEERLRALQSHPSYLNPLWYGGAWVMGVLAGAAGDKWSLGFLAETERQVVQHLEEHLCRLPMTDAKSRAVLLQMKEDEQKHATAALQAGGVILPVPVQRLMALTSRVMTRTAYWI